MEVDIPQFVVPDTLLALGKLARAWRDRFHLPIVGVTGSNGKTTLKNMIASILRAASHPDEVLATEGNLNNNIGLPLNLARLNDHHRYAVLEMGMNHFGEIAYLTQLAKPTVAVITNAAESHLEGLKDIQGVAIAKGEIFLGLQEKGTAILNKDDPHYEYWRTLVQNKSYATFGLKNPADVTALNIEGSHVTLNTPKGLLHITLPLLGKHNVLNALAATAAALALSIPLDAIKKGLEHVSPAPHRMRLYSLANRISIIDDTYNANPFSLKAAVETLATFQGTKIVVLGDMKELGENEKALHTDSGDYIRHAGIDYLLTLGHLTENTAKAFGQKAMHFREQDKLIMALQPYLKENVTVLIKGSRSMRMENIVEHLIPKEQFENAH
jgi:UDP-N-acetylmuramoyl-tripeptide--D-alanyl-D-alanine ligase